MNIHKINGAVAWGVEYQSDIAKLAELKLHQRAGCRSGLMRTLRINDVLNLERQYFLKTTC
jgi:hypothetical protein